MKDGGIILVCILNADAAFDQEDIFWLISVGLDCSLTHAVQGKFFS